jgi:hypothetical protein
VANELGTHVPPGGADVKTAGGDILISAPVLSRVGNVSRVEAVVDDTPAWFESADETLAARPEIFAAAFLGPAMAASRRVRVDAPLDKAWLESVSNILRHWHNWWGYDLDEPIAGGSAAAGKIAGTEPTNSPLVASCFTGGVDSFYTLLRSPNAPAINRLLFVHGYDIPLADETRMAAWEPALRRVATAVGRPAIVVRTNLRLHPLFRASNWERTHGGALAAVRHAIAAPGALVIPSSHTYGHSTKWGSHHLTDLFWSTPTHRIEHCEALLNRRQKLRLMATADEPLLPETLRVCWEGRTATGNCSICEKCVRTMLVLHQCNRLDRFTVFDQSISLAARIDGLGLLPPHLRYVYEGMLKDGLSGDVRDAVRRMLAKSRPPGLMRRAVRKAKRVLPRITPGT